MLDYVNVLTETPWAVTEKHVIAMRDNGFSDEAISVTNLVACFFAWCNRVVDGLGAPLEDYWPEEIRAREEEVKSTPPGS
jgi:alkylhydroperoxidase family enzyme